MEIAKKIANGYILSIEGKWISAKNGRVTTGGNINIRNMEASLETERLVKLANHNNCQPQDMLPEIIKAAEFIGAYSDQFCANPYEYGEGECTPSDEHVRNQLANAREVARI